MTEEFYQKAYQFVKDVLYSDSGLGIVYFDNVANREDAMNKNQEVARYMADSIDNERAIIDEIINRGVAEINSWQYLVNMDNFQKFVNASVMVPMARDAYEKLKLESLSK